MSPCNHTSSPRSPLSPPHGIRPGCPATELLGPHLSPQLTLGPVFFFLVKKFSNKETEAKRGKWFDSQSCTDLQVTTVSYGLAGTLLCSVTLVTVLGVTLARKTRQLPSPLRSPLPTQPWVPVCLG